MSRPATVQALVRRTHEQRVLAVLRERGALSRAQIAERVGLSRTTLSEITADLVARGAVVVARTDLDLRQGSGRPAELLALDPGAGQFVGVDLGHSRVRVVIADAAHEIVATGVQTYDASVPWPQRQESAFGLLDRVAADHGLHFGALQGIAIGVAGPHAGIRQEVRSAFVDRFGCPVLVDNNTRFAALAEAMSDGEEDFGDLAYIRVSEGIGGGLVIGGRLVPGGRGAAGEFGHVRVVDDGVPCRCGKRGCLETVASVGAILADARRRGARLDGAEELGQAVAAGDTAAVAAVDGAADLLGRVLADAALMLSPARVVIGGQLPAMAPYVVGRIAAIIATELEAVGTGLPTVRAARLDDGDGAHGAIAALYHSSPLLAEYDLASPAAEGPDAEPWRARA
jgi:predicted NBD/HSP70 family sugar kinase